MIENGYERCFRTGRSGHPQAPTTARSPAPRRTAGPPDLVGTLQARLVIVVPVKITEPVRAAADLQDEVAQEAAASCT